ncbi:MAG: hypothetical protein NT081_02480, partial [Actinobacteria bacterium]|nr:hypothetical protein [Actinomycetota bacterium]
NVIIVTGDRDSYQLVHDPHIKVLYNKRGVSDYALYDEAGIFERTGVKPTDYVHYAALRGDPSDNLPGVPGVGEKTAAKLINQYGGIDGIYEHLDELTPKLRQNLAATPTISRSATSTWRKFASCSIFLSSVSYSIDWSTSLAWLPTQLMRVGRGSLRRNELTYPLRKNSLLFLAHWRVPPIRWLPPGDGWATKGDPHLKAWRLFVTLLQAMSSGFRPRR